MTSEIKHQYLRSEVYSVQPSFASSTSFARFNAVPLNLLLLGERLLGLSAFLDFLAKELD